MENLTVVSRNICSRIIANVTIVCVFFEMLNVTVVLTSFCSSIIAILSIDLIFPSTGKSSRCFNDFLLLNYWQSNYRFNLFLKTENLTVASTIFSCCIIANLSIVSIVSWNGKPHLCFNDFLLLDYSQSIHSFNRMLLKLGMENTEWGMENGEWGMGNGEWEIVVSGNT